MMTMDRETTKGRMETVMMRVFMAIFFFSAVACVVFWTVGQPTHEPAFVYDAAAPQKLPSMLNGKSIKSEGGGLSVSGTRSRGEDAGDYAGNIMDGVTVEHIPLTDFDYEKNYPIYTTLLDVVEGWSPDRPEPPKVFKETLAHFDYQNPQEMELALALRQAEVPFKVYNVPEFMEVGNKWTTNYLKKIFKKEGRRTTVEKSKNNHFMFWTQKRKARTMSDWKPPTEMVSMSFEQWLDKAKEADRDKWEAEREHFYFHYGTNSNSRKETFLAKDLEHFSSEKDNFFVFRPDLNKGIQCRFGMRGIIAESHYDGGRNMVAMLRGTKRYILAPPKECKNLGIISDKKHPSFRHSIIDWSDPAQARSNNFASVDAVDTIVREGEVLYIPSYWFHYIVSMEYSIQCNSRSGSPENNIGGKEIDACMGSKDYSTRGSKTKRKPHAKKGFR